MAQEIDLGGAIYVSSKRAAEITGYAQDYIGQLARTGAVIGKRISGLWYIQKDSLNQHKERADLFKPTPPGPTDSTVMDSVVSFEGKDYISAQRGAKVTGYAADYVGQLARSGKITSRQIGNRWYVDREALVAHKKHNDGLLAAVQTESVGLAPALQSGVQAPPEGDLHFQYARNDAAFDLLPQVSMKVEDGYTQPDEMSSDLREANIIPIRVISERRSPATEYQFQDFDMKRSSVRKVAIYAVAMVFVIGTVAGVIYLNNFGLPKPISFNSLDRSGNSAMSAAVGGSFSGMDTWMGVAEARQMFARKLDYRRK